MSRDDLAPVLADFSRALEVAETVHVPPPPSASSTTTTTVPQVKAKLMSHYLAHLTEYTAKRLRGETSPDAVVALSQTRYLLDAVMKLEQPRKKLPAAGNNRGPKIDPETSPPGRMIYKNKDACTDLTMVQTVLANKDESVLSAFLMQVMICVGRYAMTPTEGRESLPHYLLSGLTQFYKFKLHSGNNAKDNKQLDVVQTAMMPKGAEVLKAISSTSPGVATAVERVRREYEQEMNKLKFNHEKVITATANAHALVVEEQRLNAVKLEAEILRLDMLISEGETALEGMRGMWQESQRQRTKDFADYTTRIASMSETVQLLVTTNGEMLRRNVATQRVMETKALIQMETMRGAFEEKERVILSIRDALQDVVEGKKRSATHVFVPVPKFTFHMERFEDEKQHRPTPPKSATPTTNLTPPGRQTGSIRNKVKARFATTL